MRVAIDCRKWADGGIGRYIRGIAGALARLDDAPELLLVGNPAILEPPAGARVLEDHSPHYSIREILRVAREAEAAGAAVFHSPHYVTPRTSLPLVVTIHDLIHLHQPRRNPLEKIYAHTMMRRAAKRADAIITVSETVAHEVVTELGADAAKVTAILNGVDESFFDAEPLPRAERGSYFLFVGSSRAHKNLDLVLRAFSMPSLRGFGIRIAGEVDPARHALPPNAAIAGRVTDAELRRLYREAIAVIVASREEGFGLPAAEAMASGTPVIASRIPSLVEVTEKTARFFDVNSMEELAAAAGEVSGDGREWSDLAQRGLERAAQLRWERAARQTLAVYRRAIDAKK